MPARGSLWVCAAGVIAALLTGCGDGATGSEPGSRRPTSPRSAAHASAPSAVSDKAFRPGRTPPMPNLSPLTVTARDAFAFRAAADARHLVWVTGPVEEEGVETALMQRDLRTGRTTTLARGVDPHYGLAAAGGRVVFTETAGSTRLLAVRHDGSDPIELAR